MLDQQAETSSGIGSVTSTGTKATRALGVACLAGTALLVFLGLVGTPEDEVQGDSVRLLYIHVPAAWLAYLAFGVTALGSVLYLWKRTRSLTWDRVAGASAEIGVAVHCGRPSSPARSGAASPGASTGPGTPASPPPPCCSCSSSATSPCGGCRPSPTCERSAPRSPASSPSSTCRSSTSGRVVAHAAPGRDGAAPRSRRPDRRHHAVHAVRRASSSSPSSTCGCCSTASVSQCWRTRSTSTASSSRSRSATPKGWRRHDRRRMDPVGLGHRARRHRCVYALRVMTRGRSLAKQVPDEDKPWT